MSGWDLPQTIEIAGKEYRINADYRDILQIIDILNDPEMPEPTKLYVSANLFFDDFDQLPKNAYEEAIRQLMLFINCGEEETDTGPKPKTIDWGQDRQMIISDINKAAGMEVRAVPFLHWWTFISYFGAIGEGRLSTVVAIREKKRKGKKLDDWEREYYQEHKKEIDFAPKYTAEELAEQERIKKLLGE